MKRWLVLLAACGRVGFDARGLLYHQQSAQGLPMHVHTGELTLQATAAAGGPLALAGGWPGEPTS